MDDDDDDDRLPVTIEKIFLIDRIPSLVTIVLIIG